MCKMSRWEVLQYVIMMIIVIKNTITEKNKIIIKITK